ncbi:MAG: PDZ domain-containing protein [Campylobacterales bacterium]|nr:PDZ domain-containing protein [Campylobacterales bacterium]
MKTLFKSENMQSIIYVLALMVGVKVVWFIAALIFLPTQTQEVSSKSDVKALYYRIYLAKKEGQQIKPKPIKKPDESKTATPISALTLLGIYAGDDTIVVTVQKGSKSKVLSKGEAIDGFVLMDASRDEASFEKNGKSFTLKFKEKKPSSKSKSVVTPASKPLLKEEKKESEDVVDSGGVKIVKRNMLENYMQQPKDIWKDVGISEIKKGKEITGFVVRFVRRGSGFEKLGLQRGDILLAINGERLDSYQDAFSAYKNIQTMSNLTLTIKRKNQEMELDYEIK